jgi:hypothetical protein
LLLLFACFFSFYAFLDGSHKWQCQELEEDDCDPSDDDSDGLLAMQAIAEENGFDEDDLEIEQVELCEGDSVLHHQDVYHYSGPNQSSEANHKTSLVLHYMRADDDKLQFVPPAADEENSPFFFNNKSYVSGKWGSYCVADEEDKKGESFASHHRDFPIVSGLKRAIFDY